MTGKISRIAKALLICMMAFAFAAMAVRPVRAEAAVTNGRAVFQAASGIDGGEKEKLREAVKTLDEMGLAPDKLAKRAWDFISSKELADKLSQIRDSLREKAGRLREKAGSLFGKKTGSVSGEIDAELDRAKEKVSQEIDKGLDRAKEKASEEIDKGLDRVKEKASEEIRAGLGTAIEQAGASSD